MSNIKTPIVSSVVSGTSFSAIYSTPAFSKVYNSVLSNNPAMIWTIDTTKGDGLASFTLPTRTGFTYDAEIDWGDGTTSNITSATDSNITHNYVTGGTYQIKIKGTFSAIYFNNGGDKDKFISLDNWGNVGIDDNGLQRAWFGCSNVISFSSNIPYTNVTTLQLTWRGCSSATSFPEVNNLVNVTDLRETWRDCRSATIFPDVNNLVNVTTLFATWLDCRSATIFPEVSNLINVTNLAVTWRNCYLHTTVPSNQFDNFIASNYDLAYDNTNLTTQSIDNILVSIDNSGVLNGMFGQSGGQAPSSTGQQAITNLINKGWTIVTTV